MSIEKDPVHYLLDLIISNRLNVLQKRGTQTNCYNTQFDSYEWELPEITEDDTQFQLNVFTSSSTQRLLIETWEFEIKNREKLLEINSTNILLFRSILTATRVLPAYLYCKHINSKPNNYKISHSVSFDESPNPKLLSGVETSDYTFNLGDVDKYISIKVHYAEELSKFSEPIKIMDDISLLQQSYWGADQQIGHSDEFKSCIAGSDEFKSCLGESSVPIEILPISKLDLSDDPVFLSCISDSQFIGKNLQNDLPGREPEQSHREPSPLESIFYRTIPSLSVFSVNVDYRRQFREGKAFVQEFSHKDVFAGSKNHPQNFERRTVQRRNN